MVLTTTHNLCFRAKIGKMITPVNPRFTIQKLGVQGSTLYGLVSMINHFEMVERSLKYSNDGIPVLSFGIRNFVYRDTVMISDMRWFH